MAILERLAYVTGQPVVGRFATIALRLLGVNIPPGVAIGPGLALPHGAVGLVVHERAILGARVKLYQGVTLGRSDTHLDKGSTENDGRIEIGSDVTVGANATILFKSGNVLTVGDGAVIGANSVVLQSVPAGEIWAGNPAKRISSR
jgi:serine O-acetyltransferase